MTWWIAWWPKTTSVSSHCSKPRKKSTRTHSPMVRSDEGHWPPEKKRTVCFSLGALPVENKQMLFVCTAHIHWDPEYCDVKVVQTLMLLSELKSIMEDAVQKHRTHSNAPIDCASVPLVLCGDFNSLPDSGVIELMCNGKISSNHADFKDLRYESFLQRINRSDATTTPGDDIAHHFKLQSAYETTSSPIMPYTNYT